MRVAILFATAIVAILAGTFHAAAAPCPPESTIAERVYAAGLCLVAATYGAAEAGEKPVLVVVVHGDISDGGAATYHAAFAQTLAKPGTVAVALNRPGYADANGATSDGATLGRIDNYTPEVVGAIGAAVDALKKRYRARRVVYVGHSGGAAIGGALIGRRPGLVDIAVLVSCPCDIPRWLRERGMPPWSRSVSPDFVAHKVAKTTRVVALTGTADSNTFPALAEDYVARLKARGVDARFVPVVGGLHGFAGLADAVRAVVVELIDAP